MPGLTKDDVKVSLISNNLNITANRNPEDIQNKKSEETYENIRCGTIFFRNFLNVLWKKDINLDIPLPSNINTETIKSKMNEGLLKIKVGKTPPKKIDISTEEK